MKRCSAVVPFINIACDRKANHWGHHRGERVTRAGHREVVRWRVIGRSTEITVTDVPGES